MKAKDRFRLSVIRMARAELQNATIARGGPLEANDELSIISREVKKRQESRKDFEKAQRQDLVDDLDREVAILKEFLPEQLTAEELEQVVREAVNESGAETKRDMGKVMSLVMPRVKGLADGAVVKSMVEKMLQ